MDVFSEFCNICCKTDDESVKDISEEENMKNLQDTLITFIGHADIIKHNVIYLCQFCCKELTLFGKFREMCFSNLIQLRQTYFNMKSKLQLEEDTSVVENTLKKYVHLEVQRRNSLEKNSCPVAISAECLEILKSSAVLNEDHPIINSQVINLQSKRNEFKFDGACSNVSVINNVIKCDESRVTFTNEEGMKNKILRRSEDSKLAKFESNSDEDFDLSNINNESNTSQIDFTEEFYLKNEIEFGEYANDIKVHVNNRKRSVNSGKISTKQELHVKQEKSTSQVLQFETIETEFSNGQNVAFEIANVRTIVNMEDCEDGDIRNKITQVRRNLRSRVCNNKSATEIVTTQASRPNVRQHLTKKGQKIRQPSPDTRVFSGTKSDCCAKCNKPLRKTYKCTVCNKTFTKSSNLKAHERIHSGARPFKCNVCHSTYRYMSNLNRHERTHSCGNSYKCEVCNKSFTRLFTLTIHERTHSGEKPYKCTECTKTFISSCYLTRYKRTHDGKRPYKCTVCKKMFKQSSALTMHKRLHSGDRPYKCTICNKAFTRSAHLVRHERLH